MKYSAKEWPKSMTRMQFWAPKASQISGEGQLIKNKTVQDGMYYDWDKHEAPREHIGGTPNLMGDFLEEVTLKTISLKNFSNLVRA